MNLPDNDLVAVVKRDCETCVITEPVLAALAAAGIAGKQGAVFQELAHAAARGGDHHGRRKAGRCSPPP